MSKPPPFRLDDRVAAVTGAGSGIGEAIALLFARQGARVALVEVDPDAAQRVAAAIEADGGQAATFPCDVADSDQVARTFAAIAARFGALQVLVNNAGVAHVGSVEATEETDFDRLFSVNVKGTFLCTKHGIPLLRASGGGVIVNMASIASLLGVADRFAYSMTKGAVLTMTKSVAIDYMAENIRCNCICPARVHTPFVDGYLAANYPGREQQMFDKLSQYQPMGRMGKPEEVAHLALYLCSDESSYITGQAIPLDGGVLLV